MALDGAFLSCLREELLAALPDARIDKIHQPSREELILSLRRRGGAEKLYFSARANSPRVHFTNVALENPTQPPMFCMLLRKKLTGGRLAGIRQMGWERALYFDFDCVSELGDGVRLTLAAEIMGRHSNLILIGPDGLVIDAIKRVDWDMSSVRPVLPGLPYSPPPAAGGKVGSFPVPARRPARGGGARAGRAGFQGAPGRLPRAVPPALPGGRAPRLPGEGSGGVGLNGRGQAAAGLLSRPYPGRRPHGGKGASPISSIKKGARPSISASCPSRSTACRRWGGRWRAFPPSSTPFMPRRTTPSG